MVLILGDERSCFVHPEFVRLKMPERLFRRTDFLRRKITQTEAEEYIQSRYNFCVIYDYDAKSHYILACSKKKHVNSDIIAGFISKKDAESYAKQFMDYVL